MISEIVKVIEKNQKTQIEVCAESTDNGVEIYTNTYKNCGDKGWNWVMENDNDLHIILYSKKRLTKKLLEKIKNIKDELFLNKYNAGTIIKLLIK